MADERSRRDLLLAVAAAGLAAAGCGDDDEDTEKLDTGEGDRVAGGVEDVRLLKRAYLREQRAVAACGAALESLTGERRAAVERIREHERAHVKELRRALSELGAEPPRARRDPAVETRLGLSGLAQVEEETIRAHLDALAGLSSSDLRGIFAAILAADAEQLAVLRQLQGEQPAEAFVGGRL